MSCFLHQVKKEQQRGAAQLASAVVNQVKFEVAAKLEVDAEQFSKFVDGLPKSQIAIVSVKGMVCDFCARGIEKTFRKDKTIQKINVDLSRGKVILAYTIDKEIVQEEISRNILINGQNMTDLQVITIN